MKDKYRIPLLLMLFLIGIAIIFVDRTPEAEEIERIDKMKKALQNSEIVLDEFRESTQWIYVSKDTAGGPGDGSKDHPYNTIQEGLNAAEDEWNDNNTGIGSAAPDDLQDTIPTFTFDNSPNTGFLIKSDSIRFIVGGKEVYRYKYSIRDSIEFPCSVDTSVYLKYLRLN